MDATTRQVLDLHHELSKTCRNLGGREFISGWQTHHPYATRYMDAVAGPVSPEGYTFLADSDALTERIRRFHRLADGIEVDPASIYASSGSSPLLLAFFLLLRETGVQQAFYVAPIYYSSYYFAAHLGVDLTCLGHRALSDEDVELELPARRSVLIISDPVWIMGSPVHDRHLTTITRWQRRTGSIVMVDGTFQYTRWGDAPRHEPTCALDPDLTYRLVCPTKSLAVHGARFAYVLAPPQWRWNLHHACSVITGANEAHAEDAALQIMDVLSSEGHNRDLTDYVAERYERLCAEGVLIHVAVHPTVSYYTFAKVAPTLVRRSVTMDQRYFALSGYDDHVRVNLLHPGWAALDRTRSRSAYPARRGEAVGPPPAG